jgi:hypothetical protein
LRGRIAESCNWHVELESVCVCVCIHVYTRAGVDAGTGIVSIEQYATAVDAAIELPGAGTSIQSKRGRSRAFIFSAGVAVFPLKKKVATYVTPFWFHQHMFFWYPYTIPNIILYENTLTMEISVPEGLRY